MLPDKEAADFDVGDLKAWETDPRGEIFWSELRRMFQERVSGIRQALHTGDKHHAVLLSGQLEAIEEIIQIPRVLIDAEKGDTDED